MMKFFKLNFKLQLPNLRKWVGKLESSIKMPDFSKIIGSLSSVQRLMLICGIFFFLISLAFVAGFVLLFKVNQNLVKNDPIQHTTKIISDLKTDLVNLPIVYNEQLTGLSKVSAQNIAIRIQHETTYLAKKYQNLKEFQQLRDSISLLQNYLAQPVEFQNYYQIWAETGKTQLYLDKFIKQIKTLKNETAQVHAYYWGYLIPIWLLILAGGAGILIWLLKEVKGHVKAVQHFEGIAQSVGEGVLELPSLPYQTMEFLELQNALENHLKNLSGRYNTIINVGEALSILIKQLSDWLGRNSSQHYKIKDNLKDYTDKSYNKLDQIPDLSQRLQDLNSNITVSESEASVLRESIQKFWEVLSHSSETIRPVVAAVEEKGEYYRKISENLKFLKNLLEEIQQTVTVFNTISEQTTLLALNASIEAARAGEEGDNFSLAAIEIDELAGKIKISSKELTGLSILMGKKTGAVIRLLETSVNKNKVENKHLNDIHDKFQELSTLYDLNLTKIKNYGSLIGDFQHKGQILEKLVAKLVNLKQISPDNYKRALVALDVIGESDKLTASASELDGNLSELMISMKQIQYQSLLEEPKCSS